jgi:sec-independent protein translocase protein TatA
LIPLIGSIGWQEVLLIAAVIFILFGASRIPTAFRSLGEGLRSFKDGLAGTDSRKDRKAGDASAPPEDGGGKSSKDTGDHDS